MERCLDFNKLEKKILSIRLNDKNKTKLTVLPPTKNLYEKVVLVRERLQQLLKTDLEDASAGDIVGDIYEVVALTMSRNREEITITKDEVTKMLDFKDVWEFLNLYVNELMLYEKN
ncbi:hypothetical protein [Thomasclavelia cocleata]|uniref:hypothetical protein n=1 Tax=Thomasclavelia cocleata TaxID=69824 RepID=UPI0025702EA4|nr:hypothetical protein [Thomasclavelia cocleata]